MQKVISFIACFAVTAVAVAAAPYEPLPDRQTNKAQAARPEPKPAGSLNYSAAQVNAEAQSQGNSNITPMWDLYSQVQQMQQEIQSLRGTVEELAHQVEVMQKQERERYLDLDLRINQLREGGKNEPDSSAGVNASPLVGDDKALYQQASELRKKSNYSEAIRVLTELLRRSPDGLYAPYSDYWLGELYMVTDPKDLEAAKKHFISLLSNQPDHVKVPDAMYKLGKLYLQQNERDNARSAWQALVKKYPDKSAAKLAQDALNSL